MDIEKILDEPNHKVYVIMPNVRPVHIFEWFGDKDKDFGYAVIRIRYNRCDEETDRFHFKGRTDANKKEI